MPKIAGHCSTTSPKKMFINYVKKMHIKACSNSSKSVSTLIAQDTRVTFNLNLINIQILVTNDISNMVILNPILIPEIQTSQHGF
ncbi:hypothetical protein G9A89_022268 [Geosiphon pyriformis]|nr:hypothetical protein G9A89_022268 [Geosiphon pyriformis]